MDDPIDINDPLYQIFSNLAGEQSTIFIDGEEQNFSGSQEQINFSRAFFLFKTLLDIAVYGIKFITNDGHIDLRYINDDQIAWINSYVNMFGARIQIYHNDNSDQEQSFNRLSTIGRQSEIMFHQYPTIYYKETLMYATEYGMINLLNNYDVFRITNTFTTNLQDFSYTVYYEQPDVEPRFCSYKIKFFPL